MKRDLFKIWFYENRTLYMTLMLFGICLNAIFFTGASESLLDALIYADLLFFLLISFYTLTTYQRFYSTYAPLLEAIRNPSNDGKSHHIASMLPDTTAISDPLGALIKEIVKAQQSEHVLLEAALFNEIQSTEDYAALWAHEIKTPLSILQMTAQQIDSPQVKQSVIEEIERIQHLAEQFLYFSRSHSFTKDFLLTEVSLKKIGTECVKKHARVLISKNMTIAINMSSLTVFSDAKWLSYIVEQVLVNAIKYTAEGGCIQIYDVTDAQSSQLIIEDTGIGIAAEDLPRIFDRGFTGKTGRQSGSSTGMGLYLAHKLSKMLNHDLIAESVVNQGTKMTINFSKF